jgi:hypothetical protein
VWYQLSTPVPRVAPAERPVRATQLSAVTPYVVVFFVAPSDVGVCEAAVPW